MEVELEEGAELEEGVEEKQPPPPMEELLPLPRPLEGNTPPPPSQEVARKGLDTAPPPQQGREEPERLGEGAEESRGGVPPHLPPPSGDSRPGARKQRKEPSSRGRRADQRNRGEGD